MRKGFWSEVTVFAFGTIDEMTKEAIELANVLDNSVNFKFNGVEVKVSKNSNPDVVSRNVLEDVKNKINKVYG